MIAAMKWHTFLLLTTALASAAEDTAFFENKIRPVLVEHCYSCHSPEAKKIKGGLLLDTREASRRGGDTGPAVVPGDASKSLLLKAIRYADPDLEMPPKKKLPAEVIADFERWIAMGAPDPRDKRRALLEFLLELLGAFPKARRDLISCVGDCGDAGLGLRKEFLGGAH